MPGLIPQPFIDELLNRTDIVDLIDGYAPLKKAGNSFVACCPFHHEKTPSFNVIPKKQFYYCFGCGASGNAISFVMNYLRQGFPEAIETLATRIGLTVPKEGNALRRQQNLSLYQLLNQVSVFYQQCLKTQGQSAIAYLQQRGVNGEIAKRYHLGYAPSEWQTLEKHFRSQHKALVATGMLIKKKDNSSYDRYRQRIMFPIHDRQGRLVGFGGRALEPSQKPKYLNSPETVIFQKSHELYGLHQALTLNKTLEKIIVVEGYLDVIALAQHGLSQVVATLGTSISLFHIQLLQKYTQEIIFCFDGDAAGRQAASRALECCLPELHTGLHASFIFLPEGHDPDSLIREEGVAQFKTRLKDAKPLHAFFLQTLTSRFDLLTVIGKSQLVNAAKPYLQKIQEGAYKQLLLDEIARLSHVEPSRLSQLIADKNKTNPPKKTITRSPIRLSIALLIQHPQVFEACKDKINIHLLEGKDQNLLQKLLRQVENDPKANTATLIEPWRSTPFFAALTKLAAWEHQVPEKALTKEFLDIILFLQKQNLENKINLYIAKSRNEGLTLLEKLNLQGMLKDRHQMIDDKK